MLFQVAAAPRTWRWPLDLVIALRGTRENSENGSMNQIYEIEGAPVS
jgi:hypothetical protein